MIRAQKHSFALSLRKARLRYLPRVLLYGPPQLISLLDELLSLNTCWPMAVMDDMRWLKEFDTLRGMDDPLAYLQQWFQRSVANVNVWKAQINACCAKQLAVDLDEFRKVTWERSLHEIRGQHEHVGWVPISDAADAPQQDVIYPCDICHRQFASQASLNVHRRSHRPVDPLK